MFGIGLEDVTTVRDGLVEPLSLNKFVNLSSVGA